jgi:phosphoribosylanthranilate isomerase
LLLDTYHPTQAGGTGETFDWRLWPQDSQTKLILAGGLTVENVANAIAQTRPYGVDVSGGVERDVKGVKERQLVQRFIKEAKNV